MATAMVAFLVLLFLVVAIRGGDGLEPWFLAGLGVFFFFTAAFDAASAYASVFFGLLAFTVALPGWWSVGLATALMGYSVVGAFVVEETLVVKLVMILLAVSPVRVRWKKKARGDRLRRRFSHGRQ